MFFRFIRSFLATAGLAIAVTAGFLGVGMLLAAMSADVARPRGLAAVGTVFLAVGIYGLSVLVRAVRLQGPGPVARRVYAMVHKGKRARDWGISIDEILAEASRGRDEGVLLLFAFSVAIDTGAADAAGRLLDQAFSAGTKLGTWAAGEFLLQRAMFTALVRKEPLQARRDLATAISAWSSDHRYARLAESAVLIAEGRAEEARAALAEWTGAARDSGNRAYTEIGNHWALDMLRTRLWEPPVATPTPD